MKRATVRVFCRQKAAYGGDPLPFFHPARRAYLQPAPYRRNWHGGETAPPCRKGGLPLPDHPHAKDDITKSSYSDIFRNKKQRIYHSR